MSKIIDPDLTATLTAALAAYFTHAIGDAVIEKGTGQAYLLTVELTNLRNYERLNIPSAMIIIERKMQQCHGGLQGHYLVRRFTEDGREMLVSFMEDELIAWSEIAAGAREAVERGKKD